jgi:hypothetical protein
MRCNGKCVVFSDEKSRRFVAFSAVETRDGQLFYPQTDQPEEKRLRILKASRIIAEHIGTYSIELNNRTSTIRYLVSSKAKTASDACQKTEVVAERMSRVIQELSDSHLRPVIIEGEQLPTTFLSIIGGEFESFSDAGDLLFCNTGEDGGRFGFAMLAAMDQAFAKIDLRKLVSMIRNPDAVITYVINIKAHKTFDENVLIDGAESGRKWLVSPYFLVGGREPRSIREVSAKLRSDVEDATGILLRIQRGSSIISKLGRILLRSPLDRRLLLSNDQLINHIFRISAR